MAQFNKPLMHTNCLTPKPLGVTFITPGIIVYNTQQAFLIRPRTGIEYIHTYEILFANPVTHILET